jgi:hypothetical protein
VDAMSAAPRRQGFNWHFVNLVAGQEEEELDIRERFLQRRWTWQRRRKKILSATLSVGPGFGQTSGKHQGCQMEYFKTKNPNLGKFWRALEWKMFVYVRVIWNVYYGHLVYFIVSIW